jgi:transposase
MALRLRSLTDEETAELRQLARARTAPARTVERAQIVWRSSQGQRVPAIAEELRLCKATVRQWLKRFNDHGLAGLQDEPRPGPPKTYTPAQVSELIAAVLSKPQDLGLPFACWTLDRLVAYLSEQKGITMKRSRIDEILIAEGLRWRQQETWFGERVDPDFAAKRGPSFASTKRHRKQAS